MTTSTQLTGSKPVAVALWSVAPEDACSPVSISRPEVRVHKLIFSL